MDRKEMKKLFESMDNYILEISQMIDFLEVICSEENINDTGKYLYIIINLLKNKCERLDIKRFELQEKCLD